MSAAFKAIGACWLAVSALLWTPALLAQPQTISGPQFQSVESRAIEPPGMVSAASADPALSALSAEALAKFDVSSRFADRIADQGTARVIVTLDVPLPAADGSADQDGLRLSAIGSAREDLFADYLPGLADQLRRRQSGGTGLAISGSVPTAEDQIAAFREGDRVIYAYRSVPAFAAILTPNEMAALAADPRVVSIAEDRLNIAHLPRSTRMINADDVWAQNVNGFGAAVAILDNGFDIEHPFIAARVTVGGCFSNAAALGAGWTSLCTSGEGPQRARNCTTSGCEHGTHVAGTAAGGLNYAGPGWQQFISNWNGQFNSVSPASSLWVIQVFVRNSNGDLAASNSDIAAALDAVYTARNNFPGQTLASINMSLGAADAGQTSPCTSDSRRAIIQTLRAAGIATVISSGNDGYTNAVSPPGCIPEAVTVGAVGFDSQVASYSNAATFVDLLAPGGDFADNSLCTDGIISSVPNISTSTQQCRNDRMEPLNGTSMAAPHVAGAFALLRSGFPDATLDEIETALKSTGTTIRDNRPGNSGVQTPLINLQAAYNALRSANPSASISVTPTDPWSVGFALGDSGTETRSYTVQNTGDQALTWNATSDAAWITFTTATSGSLAVGQSTTLTARVRTADIPGSLGAGTHFGLVIVTPSAGDDIARQVVLTLSQPGSGPANDNFANAVEITGTAATVTGTNTGATAETGEPKHGTSSAGDNSVWWRWTAPSSGTVTIDTLGSSFDTTLAAYTGTAVNALTLIAGNDDISPDVRSRIQFSATAGTTYRIAVAGFGPSTGSITLNLSHTGPAAAQFSVAPTDLWSVSLQRGSATPATRNYTLSNTGGSSLTWSATSPESWIDFSAASSGTLAAGASTTLTLRINPANVPANLAAGVYDRVITLDPSVGSDVTLPVRFTLTESTSAPANDNFANAATLTGATASATGTNVGATSETGEPKHATQFAGTATVWWRWTAPSSGQTTVSTAGSNFDTTLAVYTGAAVNGLTLVGSNDDTGGLQSQVVFNASAGTTYRIAVAGYGTAVGNISLSLAHEGAPEFALTVTREGSGTGSVSSAPAGIDCGDNCSAGFAGETAVTLTAAAGANSIFAGWSGACTGTALTCQVTMDQARSVTATFTLEQRALTVVLTGAGTGTVASAPGGIACASAGGTCAANFDHGASVALTPTPDAGSLFAGWTEGDCTGTAGCQLDMTASRTATARFILDSPPEGRIVAAALPGARSGYVGGPPLTVFMTVISRGSSPAQSCLLTAQGTPPFTLSYRRVANGSVQGPENPLFDLGNGGVINFVVALTPTAETAASGYVFLPQIECQNASLVPLDGISSVRVSIGAAPVPDILSIGATPSADGVVRIPETGNRINFMSAAAVNIGAGDGSAGAGQATVTVSVDTGAASLPVTLEVCETASGGGCVTPRGVATIQAVFDSNVAKFFAVFVRANGSEIVPFNPAGARVFLRFADAGGVTRSVTSAAISAPAPADQPVDAIPAGRWSVLVRQDSGDWPVVNRAALYVFGDGTALLDDGETVAALIFERFAAAGEVTQFALSGLSGSVAGHTIGLGDVFTDQPGALWGIRDLRGDAPASWDGVAGDYGTLRVAADGSLSGTLDGCIAYGAPRPEPLAPGLLVADVMLASCAASGRYTAVIDAPANDDSPMAFVIGNGERGWRVTRR